MSRKQETTLEGIPASPGIVIGPMVIYAEPSWEPEPRVIEASQIDEQIRRFRQSTGEVRTEIEHSYQTTLDQYGKELAEILGVQLAFLNDQIFLNEVEELIQQKKYDAPYATFVVFSKKKEHFLQMSNEYFRDRAVDVHSLKKRILIKILEIDESSALPLDTPSIIIADNLSPTDTVQLHQNHVLGFATNMGGKTSHTAIIARALAVPAVVGLQHITQIAKPGDMVILDGQRGKVILNPSAATIARYEKKRRAYLDMEAELLRESSNAAATTDDRRIYLHANIEFEDELAHVLQVNCDGIGLFRTEGIFLNRRDLPSEEEQTAIYSRIAQRIHPKKLVIRTLDIGGDKIFPGISSGREDNPFLGWRAIRFWLDHKEGFLAQLKAILRANTGGNVQILLPMVSGLGEIYQVKELLEEAQQALVKEKKPFRPDIELGIMIEIPSVVIMADILAKEVDFFSIGTNDLVQYTLAVDRGNEKVANLYSHFHPAVLRMIQTTLNAGKEAGIPVGMCGEMAGDPLALPILIAMGFEYLSASHFVIPELKRIVRNLSLTECHELYEQIQTLNLTRDIIQLVRDFLTARFPSLYTV